ncbi:hypothetical protein DV515_00002101 [Chloebia gouldiae]|uniref:Acylphosphatase n=1 Tax=Chloebia gouldiae TaxID=44316 RepID=A0A3L8SW69_CHLGU|nr:hypothetical protein DV515_00002101 [Chloebia gouldiae]
MADGEGLLSVDYEVHGKVQGVFFRKYTQVRAAVRGRLPRLPAVPAVSALRAGGRGGRGQGRAPAAAEGGSPASRCCWLSGRGEAKRLGLVGWVRNTSHGTVQGQIQGPTARVQELQEWLRKIGSPQSRISRAEFSNEKKIEALEHKEFQILK